MHSSSHHLTRELCMLLTLAPYVVGTLCAASIEQGDFCLHNGPSLPPAFISSPYIHLTILSIRIHVGSCQPLLLKPIIGSGLGTTADKMALERGMQAVVTAVVFNALALVFIVLRCISRFWVIHQAGPEDYLIIFAFVLSVGTTVTIVLREFLPPIPPSRDTDRQTEKDNGLGRHSNTVSDEENENLFKVCIDHGTREVRPR